MRSIVVRNTHIMGSAIKGEMYCHTGEPLIESRAGAGVKAFTVQEWIPAFAGMTDKEWVPRSYVSAYALEPPGK